MTEACDITNRPAPPDQNPPPEEIKTILDTSKTVAVIGLSQKPGRESRDVGLYLRGHGYTVIPVNPAIERWEGVASYPDLASIPGPVDLVDIFRRAEAIDGLVDEIIAKKPKYCWFQLGVVNNAAATKLREASITVVQDRCMKIEHAALIGA